MASGSLVSGTVGDRIREARERAGITRESLAESLARSAQTVATWERGLHEPRESTLLRIADLLDCSYADLVG